MGTMILVIPRISITMLKSAAVPHKGSPGGISKAGRALMKHIDANRGQGFGTPSGTPDQISAAAQAIIEEILTNPNSTCQVRNGKVIIRLPSGQGATWYLDGVFRGLIGR